MKRTILFLLLLLSYASILAQRQVSKAIHVAKNQAKPQSVAALSLASVLHPLENTFIATNTAVQFTANEAVLKQMEREQPAFLEFAIPVSADSMVVLELIPNAIFGDKFQVLNARDEVVNVHKGVFYKGIIKGDDNSVVSLALSNGELSGIVSNDKGNYVLGKINSSRNDNVSNYIFYNDHELLEKPTFRCGVADAVAHTMERVPLTPSTTNVACRAIQIYIEADSALYMAQGANLTTATAFVNALFGQVAVLYSNEGILIQMSQLKIWDTTDPYAAVASTTNTVLGAFTAHIGSTFPGDLAHLLSARALGGGRAYLDVLCKKNLGVSTGVSGNIDNIVNNVPTYSYNVEVVAHELGHNFGSLHTQSCTWPGGPIDNCAAVEDGTCSPGPTPTNGGTIMSYCHTVLRVGIFFNNGFGPLPGNLIRSRAAACIGAPVFGTPSVTPVKCFGGSDGRVTVLATGGTGAIAYTISPNTGTQSPAGTFTGLPARTYTFGATDAGGCSSTMVLNVTQPATLSLGTSSVTNATNANGSDGSISVSAGGGTSPYTYVLSGSATTNQTGIFTGLSVGTYTFTATDNNGCTAITTAQVSYTLTLSTTNTILCGSGSLNLNSLITTNGTTVTWSEKPPATAIAAGADHSLIVLSDGTVIGRGRNDGGQANVPNTVVGATAATGGVKYSLALLSNGTVVGWGQYSAAPNTVVGVKEIAAGNFHNLALLSNGSVVGWGDNYYGQSITPNTVVDATAISAGGNHSLALLDNGTVIAWGENSSGLSTIPNNVVSAKAVAAGNFHSLALLGNGSVVAWGLNSDRQINVPNTVVGAKAIAAGYAHSLALLSNGTVVGWGSNGFQETIAPNTVVGAKAIAAGDFFSLALLGNGSVVGWGNNFEGQSTGYDPLPLSNTTITPTATKTYYVVVSNASGAIKTGSVTISVSPIPPSFGTPSVTNAKCFGSADGQVTALSTGGAGTVSYSVIPIAGSQSPAGTFTGLPANTYTFTATDINGCTAKVVTTVGQPTAISFNTPSVINSSSVNGTDGRVWVGVRGGSTPYTYARSGSNTTNQTGLFTGLSAGTYTFTATDNVGCTKTITVQVFDPPTLTTTNTTICNAASLDLNSLITTNGSTVTWSEKPQATAIAAGGIHSLALLSNGTVIGWGNNGAGQTTTPNTVVGAKAIAAGFGHSLALLGNGSVVAWGRNFNGQTTVPNTVVGATAIAAGADHNLALLSNGTVVGWGNNASGQTTVPNTVVNATAMTGGDSHSLALLNNGTVVGWGDNVLGQRNIPNTVVGATAIAAGDYHNLALLGNGSVIGWGGANIAVPNTVVGAKAIATGSSHSLALLSNGTVVGWGINMTIPNTAVGVKAIAAGGDHSLALLSNGSVIGWGDNTYGQAANYDPLPLSNTAVSPTITKTYYVVVTNANGDKTTGSVTITVNPIPTPPATTTNNALSFDGTNDCVQITKCSGSLFAGGDALTIEYWFKGTSNQSAVRMEENNAYIVAGRNGQHVLSNDGGLTGISVGTGYTDGNWHHIAMTWQRNGLFTSYLDGNQVAQRAASNTPLPAFNSGVYLGALNGTSEFMNGTLDEVRLWTVARSQAQIQTNMNVCTLLDQTNLLMYYRFDHGTTNGSNTAINTLRNTVNANELTGTLNGFSLSSTSSNWTTGRTCGVALPVELIDFKGTPHYKGNLLTWTTANEVNNKGFYVERALQPPKGALTTWEVLDFVNAKSKAATYEFLDVTSLSGAGDAYYRLRQIDRDGKETFSKIVSIERKSNNKLKVYPNSVSNILTIENNNGNDFQVINLLGQTVMNGKAAQAIDVSALLKGNYFLKVGTEQVKFVKQ